VRLVGSSIGGWVTLLAARALGQRCDGLVLIAAAPDITTQMQAGFSPEQRAALARDGVAEVPTPWGPPFRISQSMLDDAAAHFVMRQKLMITAPVRLLHGQRDGEVPWPLSLAIAEHLEADDVRVLLVKDGDHRLSRPADLALLCEALASLHPA
ncbi:alpha/beta hydrolase, partial [Endobacter medicaginis]